MLDGYLLQIRTGKELGLLVCDEVFDLDPADRASLEAILTYEAMRAARAVGSAWLRLWYYLLVGILIPAFSAARGRFVVIAIPVILCRLVSSSLRPSTMCW